jgi:hypothetical protein
LSEGKGIPSFLIRDIIKQWKKDHGSTFPLYGNETVRHDISGSVRPLLTSTEIPHERILSEASGVSKRTIMRIQSGETKFVSEEITEKLLIAMNRADCWYVELDSYR